MKLVLKRLLFVHQKLVVKLSYFIHSKARKALRSKNWAVVGMETASMLHNLSSSIQNSTSVNFADNRFYKFSYKYSFPVVRNFKILDLIWFRPWLLGKLLPEHKGFIYVGGTGFCLESLDGRDWEFGYIKKKNKKLVCYFVGSEIRSTRLMDDFGKVNDIDVITTYQRYSSPELFTDENESKRKLLGQSADKYADEIFNPSVDQIAYINRQTQPCQYFLPRSQFSFDVEKFSKPKKLVILHGPSSPLLKGTPLVRAAIKRLRTEGYQFEYRELINSSHDEVLNSLRNAHIVLNEFYAMVPGVFTMEALAKGCAVLTSADPRIEKSLSPEVSEAWCVTPYWLIYENLKQMLDDIDLVKKYATRGYEWALNNVVDDVASSNFIKLIEQIPERPYQ